ncbi:MAG: cytochrome c [Sphingobacteriales bacterium]|nr:MAG: cytochrome c [Sphingobacteriales bacterium]
MKKVLLLTGIIAGALSLTGCGGAHGNDPGDAYMPDMYYSRAYEAYGYNNQPEDHNLKARGAYYNGMPVPGSIARGDAFPFALPAGDSGYAMAATYKSPAQPASITPAQAKEAQRLYQINCAICHGTALDGNGPLWKGGDGPFPAAPRNLTDDYTKKLSDGQIYHVITYGKGQMGSYASQVHPEQRWWIINYIRSKQGVAAGAATTTDSTGKAGSTANPAAGAAPAAAQANGPGNPVVDNLKK